MSEIVEAINQLTDAVEFVAVAIVVIGAIYGIIACGIKK